MTEQCRRRTLAALTLALLVQHATIAPAAARKPPLPDAGARPSPSFSGLPSVPSAIADSGPMIPPAPFTASAQNSPAPQDSTAGAGPSMTASADSVNGTVTPQVGEFYNTPLTHSGFISLTITSTGKQPLRLNVGLTNTPYFWVVTGLPLVIPANSSTTITVAFQPNRLGRFRDTLTLVWNGMTPAPPIPLGGTGAAPNVDLPTTFDFGSIPFGTCLDTTIALRNRETVPLALTRMDLTTPGSPQFSILDTVSAPRFPIAQPDSIKRIHVRFCGRTFGTATSAMEVEFDGASFRTVGLRGTVTAPMLTMDTASTVPGEIAQIHVKMSGFAGDTNADMALGRYSIRFRVPPDALFPSGATAPLGVRCDMRHDNGTITIATNAPITLGPQREVAALALRGLSTGNAVNYVSIDSAYFDGFGNTISDNRGIVYLEGCDVGTPIAIGPRLAIRSIRADAGGNLILRYGAPSGTAPRLRLYDLVGSSIAEMPLAPGPSDEQTVTLPTELRMRGLYLVEIRAGGDRATALVPFGGR